MTMGLENLAATQSGGMSKSAGQNASQNGNQSMARMQGAIGAAAMVRVDPALSNAAVKPTPTTASATKQEFAAEQEPVVIDYEQVPIGGPDKFAKSMAIKSAKLHEAREEASAQVERAQARVDANKNRTQPEVREQADSGLEAARMQAARADAIKVQAQAVDMAAQMQAAADVAPSDTRASQPVSETATDA